MRIKQRNKFHNKENENLSEVNKLRALPWSLAHITFNNFFYTWTFGSSIFPLFLSEYGIPKDQIGIILSFFPFAGLLALFFGRKVSSWGRKLVYLLGYGIRKPVMATLLLLPYLSKKTNYQTTVVFIFVILLIVAILRAFAETGFYPWFQEYVPNNIRGKYASATTILTTLTSMLALWIASRVVSADSGLNGYLYLIAGGVVLGIIGVICMIFVPGGKPIRTNIESISFTSSLLLTIKDRNFVNYLRGTGSFTLASFLLGSFLPLIIKEQIGLPSGYVIRLDIFSMFGAASASLIAGILVDRVGSRPILIPGLVASICIPIGWIFLFQIDALTLQNPVLICYLLYFAFGVFSSSASIAAGRLLFNFIIPFEKNTSYTSLYYAWIGFMGGIAPFLAGRLLESLADFSFSFGIFSFSSYHILFLLSAIFFFLSFYYYRRIKVEKN